MGEESREGPVDPASRSCRYTKEWSFAESAPILCGRWATQLLLHRYGEGWYCEHHANVVQQRWSPEPTEVAVGVTHAKKSFPSSQRRSASPRRPLR